jgi:hypothetical protein
MRISLLIPQKCTGLETMERLHLIKFSIQTQTNTHNIFVSFPNGNDKEMEENRSGEGIGN